MCDCHLFDGFKSSIKRSIKNVTLFILYWFFGLAVKFRMPVGKLNSWFGSIA